jgi:hypothetical protein
MSLTPGSSSAAMIFVSGRIGMQPMVSSPRCGSVVDSDAADPIYGNLRDIRSFLGVSPGEHRIESTFFRFE